jgi:hypothetical protein
MADKLFSIGILIMLAFLLAFVVIAMFTLASTI